MRPTISLTCALLVLSPVAARAQPTPDPGPGTSAKRYFTDGVAAAQQHDFAAAITQLEASYRLNPVPEVLLDIALSQKALGRSLEAITNIRRYISEASARPHGLDPARQAEAQAILTELQSKVATLQLIAPSGAELRIDDNVIGKAPVTPFMVEPGTHHVAASSPGAEPVRAELQLAAGSRRTYELAPVRQPAPPAPPPAVVPPAPVPPRSPPALVEVRSPSRWSTTPGRVAIVAGVGALGLFAASAVTGGIVLSDRNDYRASCLMTCNDAEYARAHTLANTTDLMIGLGAAAAVTATVLVLMRPGEPPPRVVAAPTAAPGMFGLTMQGAF